MREIKLIYQNSTNNPFRYLAYSITFFVFVIYVDIFFENKEFQKFSLKEISETYQTINGWRNRDRNPSVAYKLITNNGESIKLVGIPSIVKEIKPNDRFYVLKSNFLGKNIKIKYFNKVEFIEENISVLNTLLFKISFLVVTFFSIGYIVFPKSNFFQNGFPFIGAIGTLLLIAYFAFC